MATTAGGDVILEVLAGVRELGTKMERLEGRMGNLEGKLEQVRTELEEGVRQVHVRIDRTNDMLNLVGSVLHRATGAVSVRIEDLDRRVRVLETR